MIIKTLSSIPLLLFVILISGSPIHICAQQKIDSASVYFRAKIFLGGGNFTFYKYGNIKPLNLADAFCVFLTGDEEKLMHFKDLELLSATDYATNPENNLMRYDWGCESFMTFSKYMIDRYGLWAPKLQYLMAVQCFHAWMNCDKPNFEELSKKLRSSNKKLNELWKSRYKEFTRYANNEHLKGKTKRKHQRFLRKSCACSL